jgi:hypothetical protein
MRALADMKLSFGRRRRFYRREDWLPLPAATAINSALLVTTVFFMSVVVRFDRRGSDI